MLRRSYHVGVDGGLLDVTGNACHKSIAVLKVGVEVGLRVVKEKNPGYALSSGILGLYKLTEDLGQLLPGKRARRAEARCRAADLEVAAPPAGPHWTEHLPESPWTPSL